MSGNPHQTNGNPSVRPRVRVAGVVELVRSGDASFVLKLDSGQDLACRLVGRPVEELARLLKRRVVAFGAAVVSPGGETVGVDVDGYLPEDDRPLAWPSVPRQWTAEEKEEMARRLGNVLGRWPGDETAEEVEDAPRELS